MIDPTARHRQYSRREALGLLGTAAVAGAAASGGGLAPLHAQQRFTSVAPPAFAEGAVIRTLQGDLDPAALAEGATLFHEHVSRTDVDLAVEELRACAFDGLGCIVDAATGRRTPEQVERLNAIAARSEVRIVMAGGYFEDIGFAIYPVRVAEMSEDELVEETGGRRGRAALGRVRRDRLVARDAAGRAEGAPGHRPRPPADRAADLHAHAARKAVRAAPWSRWTSSRAWASTSRTS